MHGENTGNSVIISFCIFIFIYYPCLGKERKEYVCDKKIETEQQHLLMSLLSKANFLLYPLKGSNGVKPE